MNSLQSDIERSRGHAAAWPVASRLLQSDGDAGHGGRKFDPDLGAAELQDHAVGVLQLNARGATGERATGTDSAVGALNGRRPPQIESPSNKLGGRGPDRKADAHARAGERITLDSQHQHALASSDPDDEPAFREYDGDLTGFGPRCRDKPGRAGQSQQRNDSQTYPTFSHCLFSKYNCGIASTAPGASQNTQTR